MYRRLLLCCLIHSLISVSISYVPRHSIKAKEEIVSKSEHHDESKEHEVKHEHFDLTPTVVYPKSETGTGSDVEKHNHKDKNQEKIEHEIKHIFKEVKENSHGVDKSIQSHAKDEHKLHGEDHHKHSDHSLFISSRRNPSLYHSEEHVDDRDKVDFNVFKSRSHQSEEFDGIGDIHKKHDNDEHKVDFNIFKQVKDDAFEGRSRLHEAHDDIAKKHLHHDEVNAHKHHDLSCKDTKVIEHSACENKDYHVPLPHDNHHSRAGNCGFEKHDVGSTINKKECHDEHHLHDEKKHHFDEHHDKTDEVHHHASGKSEHKHDAKHLECEPKKPEHSLHHHDDHVHHHDHHFKHHTPTIKDHHRDHDFEDSHEFIFPSEHHHKHQPHVHPHHHDYDYHHHHHHPYHHHDYHHYDHNVKSGHHYHH